MKPPHRYPPFAKKSLGQNFLVDQNYIRKIVDAVDPQAGDTIVEIGPGRGALTERLVESGANIIAIELDRLLARELAERFAECENFELFERDALDVEFGTLLKNPSADAGGSALKLVANLPYYISTAILQRLAEQRGVFIAVVLMFQKEVVTRITAAPGNSTRGYLTVIAESAFDIEKLFDVPPTAFFPKPKVWSSVVRLVPKPASDLDNERFPKLLSTSFSQKRKTLLNNLKAAYVNAAEAIEQAEIDPNRRAETLTLDEWSAVYRSLVQSET